MTRRIQTLSVPLILCLGMALLVKASDKSPPKEEEDDLPVPTISWEKHILTVTAPDLPGGKVDIWYLEAYCRPGSTDRVWNETVIGHETEKLAASPDGTSITLRCTLKDGVTVDHLITSVPGGVEFKLKAHNPTKAASEAHWAQPCMRVGEFTGTAEDPDKYTYIKNCFVYLGNKIEYMPTRDWATEARYVPGQVWAAPGVDRDDVNPRPLNKHVPSNGLIGCVSKDKSWTLAIAFEPYQELFQGVIRCIHSDFRIGGLKPGETKEVRGKLYLQPGTPDDVFELYSSEFPKQVTR